MNHPIADLAIAVFIMISMCGILLLGLYLNRKVAIEERRAPGHQAPAKTPNTASLPVGGPAKPEPPPDPGGRRSGSRQLLP